MTEDDGGVGGGGSMGLALRLRRVKSTSMAEEIVTENEKQRRAQPDKPIHKPKDSLFSWSSGFQDFEGVINWAMLMLCLLGTRLFLENLMKYGILVDPSMWMPQIFNDAANINSTIGADGMFSPKFHVSMSLILYSHVIVWLTLLFEKLIASEWIGTTFGSMLQLINISSLILVPIAVINIKHEHMDPARGTLATGLYTVLFLKLWSYIQVNHWCRGHHSSVRRPLRYPSVNDFQLDRDSIRFNAKGDRRKAAAAGDLVQYPDNLTLRDIYYFWLAPTLCYELNFPKMQRTRKFFLIRRALEVIVGTNIVLGLIQQWIIPGVVHSLIPLSNMEILKAVERVLKIAVPNHLIWLVWFYLIFHSFLNTMGEIMRFADREFYHDWWNSNNVLDFWKSWNIPVHRWCVRHMFKPLLRSGHSVLTCQVAVFLFSAVLHEYLISVPLRMFKAYAFMGMMFQIPLIFITKQLEVRVGPRAGNICVWLSLIIGQPLAAMMYYHDFVIEHYGAELISYWGKLH